MAVVQTTVVPTFSRTPFVKPPDLQREFTAMPRSIVNFAALNGVLDAKPVNDQQELTIPILLPREFAYRWVGLNVNIIQDVAHDWTNTSYVEIVNGVRSLVPGAVQRWSCGHIEVDRIPTLTELSIARFALPQPTDVIQARDGAAPTITYKASNTNAAVGAAGTVDCLFTFLEFDIEQAQRFLLHWPTLTYSRA